MKTRPPNGAGFGSTPPLRKVEPKPSQINGKEQPDPCRRHIRIGKKNNDRFVFKVDVKIPERNAPQGIYLCTRINNRPLKTIDPNGKRNSEGVNKVDLNIFQREIPPAPGQYIL